LLGVVPATGTVIHSSPFGFGALARARPGALDLQLQLVDARTQQTGRGLFFCQLSLRGLARRQRHCRHGTRPFELRLGRQAKLVTNA
jgi:hypothetical protein